MWTPVTPRPPAHQAAALQLRRAILGGEFAAGDRLPAERDLAVQLGVSRLTLRAALATLEAAGLVTVRHGSGYRVRDPQRAAGPDSLHLLAELAGERGELPALAAELLRVRRGLARAVLERLVERPPTEAARRTIGRAIDALAATATPDAAAAADVEVFAAVLAATRSSVYALCLNPIVAVLAGSPALRAVLYRDVALNVAAWRAALVALATPTATTVPRLVDLLAHADEAAVALLRRRRRAA